MEAGILTHPTTTTRGKFTHSVRPTSRGERDAMRVQPAQDMTFHPNQQDDWWGGGGSESLWGSGTRSSLDPEQLEVLSDGRRRVSVTGVEATEGG